MECEICGRYIERGKRVKIEGSIVTTCEDCSKYAEVVREVRLEVKKKDIIPKKPSPVVIDLEIDDNEGELIDDYYSLIRESREKLRLKQEELAKAINEPISLIQRIESGKIKPSTEVVKKIQKRLKIRLFESEKNIELGQATRKISKGNFWARKTAKQFLGPMSQRLIRAQSEPKALIREKNIDELTLGDLVVVKKRKK